MNARGMYAITLVPITELDPKRQMMIRELRNLESVRKYMFTDHVITEAEHRRWIERLALDPSVLVFAILNEEGNPIGVISARNLNAQHQTAEVGSYLAETARFGVGAAVEFHFLNHLFDDLGLEKLNSEVIEGNDAAVNFNKRFGFETEGFRRSNVVKSGQRLGVHLLGLTRERWHAVRMDLLEKFRDAFDRFRVEIRAPAPAEKMRRADEVQKPVSRHDKCRIGDRPIGGGKPVLIVGEVSANHLGSLERAIHIVRALREAGADAVKLQTYTPDTLTINCSRPEFRIGKGSIWEGRTLYDLYGEAYTPWEWHAPLKEEAERLGLIFFSTPFDFTAVDFLENLGVPLYKIASFELVDIPLIRRVARTGKPIIMSTGMATLDEITEAVEAARAEGNDQIVLLKCNSAYPAPPEEMNLRTIPDMIERFGVPVGLSDHTLGIAAAVAAVALGACVIEKHFTLRRADGGPDAAFSLEPHEFAEMVRAIREVERALGRVSYEVTPREAASRVFRRSLFVVEDMRAGDVFTERNVRSIRPGHGLPPKHLPEILGRRATRDVERGTPLSWDLIEPSR